VRVITALGVEHIEGHATSRDAADSYARTAIADHCLSATVIRLNGGTSLSVWNSDRLQRWNLNRGF
jgi:hypothetical protein